MKTFILAIFSLLALANAQLPINRKPPHAWNLKEEDVYGGARPPAKTYAYPGISQRYEQPVKYVQFKLNYLLWYLLLYNLCLIR